MPDFTVSDHTTSYSLFLFRAHQAVLWCILSWKSWTLGTYFFLFENFTHIHIHCVLIVSALHPSSNSSHIFCHILLPTSWPPESNKCCLHVMGIGLSVAWASYRGPPPVENWLSNILQLARGGALPLPMLKLWLVSSCVDLVLATTTTVSSWVQQGNLDLLSNYMKPYCRDIT